ncbi:hypothetical protein N9I19_16190 [Peribacillus sp. CSMR9]|nr:hypothetical protein [Peribacillus sp. CSMR9]
MSIFIAKYAIYISKIDVKIKIDLKIKKVQAKNERAFGMDWRLVLNVFTHEKEGTK